jgi:uncharacterized cupin superfamily protein
LVALKPGEAMRWHSTKDREELIIILAGQVQLEVERPHSRRGRTTLQAGQCALLPRHMLHTVVNRSARTARYLYITGR